MFINLATHYIPEQVITNSYFSDINGLSDDWIVERTGIRERRKASKDENTHTMAISAVEKALDSLPYDISEIDLIVGATYTPYDTIHTLAHAIQHKFSIKKARAVTISSACSSMVNAMEIVEGYFATGKSQKALVISSDHNTAYSDDKDAKAGHLWGDGASATFLSSDRQAASDIKVKEIITHGAGDVSKAHESVFLRPSNGGFAMPNGKDVFIHACMYMGKVTEEILRKNQLSIDQMNYFIPHQANLRITRNIMTNYHIDERRVVSNVERLGNTGCAGCGIGLSEKWGEFQSGEVIVITVFGGGYSYGSALLVK